MPDARNAWMICAPEMSVPLARGAPWFQRARYVAAPLRNPLVRVRTVTSRTSGGSTCSILVIDDGVPLKMLLARMLAGQTQVAQLARLSILSVPGLIRREAGNYDLVLAKVPQVLAEMSYRSG